MGACLRPRCTGEEACFCGLECGRVRLEFLLVVLYLCLACAVWHPASGQQPLCLDSVFIHGFSKLAELSWALSQVSTCWEALETVVYP